WDVALFDQQGCLSPQFAAVECGGVIEPRAFAERLAGALASLAVRFPRGSLSPGEATHIQSLRDTARFQSSSGAVVALWESPDSTDWTVVYRDGRDGLQSCRNRFITIVPVTDLRRDMTRLCPGLPISTIGVAASMGANASPRRRFRADRPPHLPAWHHGRAADHLAPRRPDQPRATRDLGRFGSQVSHSKLRDCAMIYKSIAQA
ncbi:MAG TPA: acyl-CoA reductase, partial [Dehalococcoidia bacterium]